MPISCKTASSPRQSERASLARELRKIFPVASASDLKLIRGALKTRFSEIPPVLGELGSRLGGPLQWHRHLEDCPNAFFCNDGGSDWFWRLHVVKPEPRKAPLAHRETTDYISKNEIGPYSVKKSLAPISSREISNDILKARAAQREAFDRELLAAFDAIEAAS